MADFAFTLICHWAESKFTQIVDPHVARRQAVTGKATAAIDNDNNDNDNDVVDDNNDDDN